MRPGQEVAILNGPLADGEVPARGQGRPGASRSQGWSACPSSAREAGDIVLVTGIDDLTIGTTLAAVETPEALPPITVDEPTLSMYFQVNTSPLAGREGKYVTSRNLRDRLQQGAADQRRAARRGDRRHRHVPRLRPRRAAPDDPDREHAPRRLRARGVAAARRADARSTASRCEPYEALSVDVEEAHQGAVMEALGPRRGELTNMESDGTRPHAARVPHSRRAA